MICIVRQSFSQAAFLRYLHGKNLNLGISKSFVVLRMINSLLRVFLKSLHLYLIKDTRLFLFMPKESLLNMDGSDGIYVLSKGIH